ncbi:MAG: hypothetical protein PHG19_08895 [Anaerotignum sp.]|nr:hypothetical protein [Anaerotignum sp.]
MVFWKVLDNQQNEDTGLYGKLRNKEYLVLYAKIQDEFESYIQKNGNLDEDKLEYDYLERCFLPSCGFF